MGLTWRLGVDVEGRPVVVQLILLHRAIVVEVCNRTAPLPYLPAGDSIHSLRGYLPLQKHHTCAIPAINAEDAHPSCASEILAADHEHQRWKQESTYNVLPHTDDIHEGASKEGEGR